MPPSRAPPIFRNTPPKTSFFSLVVDDFGVKYVGKDNANHLIQALKKIYTISINWYGALYYGLSIAWDYSFRTCKILMPSYLTEALNKFQHPPPLRQQESPHAWKKTVYCADVQYANRPNDPPPPSP